MLVYHFLDRKYGLQALKKQRLKISRILGLNDPFEFLAPDLSDPDFRQAFLAMKNQMAKNRGLLCFSKNRTNPLLWGHYADKHQGLCLGLDVPRESLHKVRYTTARSDPKKLLLGSRPDREKEMENVFATKYTHWRYENEVRLWTDLSDMDRKSGHYFLEFSNELRLKKVVVGAESDISRKEIEDALGTKFAHIERFKARAAFSSFRVIRNKDAHLWK